MIVSVCLHLDYDLMAVFSTCNVILSVKEFWILKHYEFQVFTLGMLNLYYLYNHTLIYYFQTTEESFY